MSVPWGSGWTALYVTESPDVIFFDRAKDMHLSGRITRFPIDQKMFSVVKRNTLRVFGLVGNNGPVWGEVDEESMTLIVKRPRFANKSTVVQALLVGDRRDTEVPRWPRMSRKDFELNEARIRSMYPKEIVD